MKESENKRFNLETDLKKLEDYLRREYLENKNMTSWLPERLHDLIYRMDTQYTDEGNPKSSDYIFIWEDNEEIVGCILPEEQMILDHTNEKPVLPEKFEFFSVKRSIVIKKEKENKEQYIDLLLEADPSKDMINDYLRDGELFVLTYKETIACVAVVKKIDDETIELKNIATKEVYRGQGYGKKMLKYLADNYKQKYKKMLVGTSENNITFYVKQGFDKYEKTIKNYFEDNYDEEIIDGDLHCIDMYYYSKDLKK